MRKSIVTRLYTYAVLPVPSSRNWWFGFSYSRAETKRTGRSAGATQASGRVIADIAANRKNQLLAFSLPQQASTPFHFSPKKKRFPQDVARMGGNHTGIVEGENRRNRRDRGKAKPYRKKPLAFST